MASGTEHIDHVRTQLPYALLAGVRQSLPAITGAAIDASFA